MKKGEKSFYGGVNRILSKYANVRWFSRQKDIVVGEKIDPFQSSILAMLLKYPRSIIFHTTVDSIKARRKLCKASCRAGNGIGWQLLFRLFNEYDNVYVLKEKTQTGYYTLYVVVRDGLSFSGIKTNVIEP